MSLIDDDTATVEELSEELIFLIAAVSTDAQRKRAIDLFRRFARLAESEAYRRGQASVRPPAQAMTVQARTVQSPSVQVMATEPSIEATGTEPEQPLVQDRRVSLIPPVSWQD